MYLINTLLGFLIAQILAILNRNKSSEKNPDEFSIGFFLKDTWQKMFVSLLLSFLLSITVYLNAWDFGNLFGQELEALNNLVYLVLGFAPEKILQIVRKKYNVL